MTKTRYIVLAQLRGEILQYDETLTMSTRMAAATGNVEWIERYQKFEPLSAPDRHGAKLAKIRKALRNERLSHGKHRTKKPYYRRHLEMLEEPLE